MVRLKLVTAMAALAIGVPLASCAEKTPQQIEADRIRDAADAQADQIEAEADNRASALQAQAAELLKQSGTGGSYDAQMAKVRSDALKKESELVRAQARAQARAVRDQGTAQASALLAQ